MKRICAVIALVGVLAGCATSPLPVMPKFTTDKSKACARTCQATYAQCNAPCGQITGGIPGVTERSQCLGNCNQVLSDCYSTCEE